MRDTFTEEQIDAACDWWSKTLAGPKYDALGGQRDRAMEMGQVMMSTFGSKLTDEQIAAFASHLRDVLSGRCDHTWTSRWAGSETEYRVDADCRTLSVDYDPSVVLHHCGEVAGFPRSFFWPCKTTMWLRDGQVRVRYGYGAEIVDLLQSSPTGETK